MLSWNFPTNGVRPRIARMEAGADAALAHFDGVVLRALQETETALSGYARELERQHALHLARDQAAEAARQERRRMRLDVRPIWRGWMRSVRWLMRKPTWRRRTAWWRCGRSTCSLRSAEGGSRRNQRIHARYPGISIDGRLDPFVALPLKGRVRTAGCSTTLRSGPVRNLCLGHNMSPRSMYATQNQDEPGRRP